jgi:excisionase family DNA binding protein
MNHDEHQDQPPRLAVTVKTAANLLEVSVTTINRLVRGGQIVKLRISPNTTRIPIKSLEDFIASTSPERTERQ